MHKELGRSIYEETSVTLRDMVCMHPWPVATLLFGALVRVFTLDQVARFLFGGNASEAHQSLQTLEVDSGTIGHISDFELPAALGGAKTDVYFATDEGGEQLRRQFADLLKRLRVGRPQGKMLGRVVHELLITEVFVREWPRYEVIDFMPDEEIRRRIRTEQCRRRRANIPPLSKELTPDFMLVVQVDGNEVWRPYEVAVSYSARQLEQKPKDITWLTCSATQADTIEKVVGKRPIIISNIDSVAKPQPCPTEKQQPLDGPTAWERRIIEAISALGGVTSAGGVADYLKLGRANVSRTLNALVTKGSLRKDYGSLQPGVKPGRAVVLYTLPGVQLESYYDKLIALTRIKFVSGLRPSTYGLVKTEEGYRLLLFAHPDSTKSKLVVYLDDGREPLDLTAAKLRELHNRWHRSARLYVGYTVPGRGSLLEQKVPSFKAVNAVNAFKIRTPNCRGPVGESANGAQEAH